MMAKPKILLLDIETTPNLVTSWGLHIPSGYLPPENVVQERTILCGSYQWYGQKQIASLCVTEKEPLNDFCVVGGLHAVLTQADAVVAHNGDHFDIPWILTRSIHYGLPPIRPLIQIDTRKIAKAKFYFNSNKLEYLAKFLGIGHKIKTEFDLWKDCLKGSPSALQKMVKYNQHDVKLLRGVFEKLRPFVPAKINAALFTDRPCCPTCQSSKIQSRGLSYTVAYAYRQYQCTVCGHWFRDRRSVKNLA
jgi:hypothetical protein